MNFTIMYIVSEEDRKWFMEAMQAQSVDVIKRMKEITLVMQTPEQVLEAQGVTSADIEGSIISQMGSSAGPFFKFCFILSKFSFCLNHILILDWFHGLVNW